MKWTEEKEDLLVELWRENTHLYDIESNNYSLKDMRAKTLAEMMEKLGCTGKFSCSMYVN